MRIIRDSARLAALGARPYRSDPDDKKNGHIGSVHADARYLADRAALDYDGKVVFVFNCEEAKAAAEERGRKHGILQALGVIADLEKAATDSGREWAAKLLLCARADIEMLLCHCSGNLEDPGPTHIEACPYSDPNY